MMRGAPSSNRLNFNSSCAKSRFSQRSPKGVERLRRNGPSVRNWGRFRRIWLRGPLCPAAPQTSGAAAPPRVVVSRMSRAVPRRSTLAALPRAAAVSPPDASRSWAAAGSRWAAHGRPQACACERPASVSLARAVSIPSPLRGRAAGKSPFDRSDKICGDNTRIVYCLFNSLTS